jgi:hypothetical protein
MRCSSRCSLSHTHTHTHTLSLSLCLFLSLTHSLTLSLSLPLSLSLSIYIYMCPHTAIHVSSYCYICVLMQMPVRTHKEGTTCICRRTSLMCPHTDAIYVSSYRCYICVLIQMLYMCPHTDAIHVSSYRYQWEHTRRGQRVSADVHHTLSANCSWAARFYIYMHTYIAYTYEILQLSC